MTNESSGQAKPKPHTPSKRKPAVKRATRASATSRPTAKPKAAPRPKPKPVPEVAVASDEDVETDSNWADEDVWADLGWDPIESESESDEPDGEHHSSEGTDLLQVAAREFIAAARTMLDVAEEAIADPTVIRTALGSFAGMTNELIRSAAQRPQRMKSHRENVVEADDPDDGFEHIVVE